MLPDLLPDAKGMSLGYSPQHSPKPHSLHMARIHRTAFSLSFPD